MQTPKFKQTFVGSNWKDSKPKKVSYTNLQNFLIILIHFMTFFICSQEQKKEQSIVSLEEFIKTNKAVNKSTKPLRIESLINNVQTAVYIEIDEAKTYGVKPVSLFTSVKNLNFISYQKFDKENIEIVNIRISDFEDLKYNIDLENLKLLKKLKYVYIVSDIRCNKSDIIPLIKNIGLCKVFYKIANNS